MPIHWLALVFAGLVVCCTDVGAATESPASTAHPVAAPATSPAATGSAELDNFVKIAEGVLKADEHTVHTVETAFTWGVSLFGGVLGLVVAILTYFGFSTLKDTKAQLQKTVEAVAQMQSEANKANQALTDAQLAYQAKVGEFDVMRKDVDVMVENATLLSQKAGDIEAGIRRLREAKSDTERFAAQPKLLADLQEAEDFARELRSDRMLCWIYAERTLVYFFTGRLSDALEQARASHRLNVARRPDRPFNVACVLGRIMQNDPAITHPAHFDDGLNAIKETLALAKADNNIHKTMGMWIHEIRTDTDLQPFMGTALEAMLADYTPAARPPQGPA